MENYYKSINISYYNSLNGSKSDFARVSCNLAFEVNSMFSGIISKYKTICEVIDNLHLQLEGRNTFDYEWVAGHPQTFNVFREKTILSSNFSDNRTEEMSTYELLEIITDLKDFQDIWTNAKLLYELGYAFDKIKESPHIYLVMPECYHYMVPSYNFEYFFSFWHFDISITKEQFFQNLKIDESYF